MDLSSKIYVAGHRGLVGSAIVRVLQEQGFDNLVLRAHELDLLDQKRWRIFSKEKPEYVFFFAAARVGGILANKTYPADFIYKTCKYRTMSSITHICMA